MSDKQYFVYKVVPPRPTFFSDQSDQEAAIMAEHVRYWTGNLQDGTTVAFGPVLDPDGVWGLGIIEVGSRSDAERIRDADPVITSGLATVELHPMPRAVVRPRA